MRRITLLVCAVGLLAASCAGDPEATITAPTTVAVTSTIQKSGDSDAVSTSPPDAAASTLPASSSTAPTTTSAPAATTASNSPATTPAAQANEDDEPVGDGPVLTSAPQPSNGDTTADIPAASDALAPVFFGLSATITTGCADADPGTVTLQWEVIGTESVAIAIGSDSQIFRLGQPPAGSLDVPLDCAADSEYFVIAENPGGRTVRSTIVAP